MPKIRFEPDGVDIQVDSTITLREAAHLAGINVHDRCGGVGSCCNCVVTVLAGMENMGEKSVLEEAVFYLDPQDRLSCQCTIHGDVVVKTD